MKSSKSSEILARLESVAREVTRHLEQIGWCRLALAESCTGGLVAASLVANPGISRYLCGSAVTYRSETKRSWLHLPVELIGVGDAVNADLTDAMALSVLEWTPEANYSAAITGHFGPDAPNGLDGVVFVAMAVRQSAEVKWLARSETRLTTVDRQSRQREAATWMLEQVRNHLPTGRSIE